MAKRRRRKMTKSQIKRAHRGARKMIRSGRAKGVNPWAVAMAAVKKKAAKRSRKRKGNRRRRH